MSSTTLEISYAGELYDRTRALFDGQVQPEGVQLRYLPTNIEDLFWRQAKYSEFDTAEFSFGAYLASVEDPNRQFDALPLFPSKAFRHAAIYINANSGVEDVGKLNGARIGMPEWSMTATLWIRGILGEHYGLDLKKVEWFTGGLEQPGRVDKSGVIPPPGFNLTQLEAHETLNEQLLKGKLDAVISARPPSAFREQNPAVRRLFTDYRQAEQQYFVETGIFPIMHIVIIRRELLLKHPWLASSLCRAFEDARRDVLPRLESPAFSVSSLAFEAEYAEQEFRLMGDAFNHGIENNRTSLEAFCRYGFEQGFTSRLLSVEELFVPNAELTGAKR